MMLFRAIRSLAEAKKMEKGDVLITRQLHPTDPKKDRTIIIVHGNLDSAKAADIQGIIKGSHHARRRPKYHDVPEGQGNLHALEGGKA